MLKTFRKKIRHRVLNYLHDHGMIIHRKEVRIWGKREYTVTKGLVARHYEKDDAWLYLLSRHYHDIIDIGCNMGQSSFLFMADTENQIVCIDPNAEALSRCAENLIVNHMSQRARFVNAFIGETEGQQIRFYSSLYDAAGSMFPGFAKTSSSIGKSYMVTQRTLDALCRELNFRPTLIKIDVEGAESMVLKGIHGEALSNRPVVIVEMHSGVELSITANTELVMKWCRQHNYIPYYLSNQTRLDTVETIEHRGRYHLLLLHQQTPFPEYLFGIAENTPVEAVMA